MESSEMGNDNSQASSSQDLQAAGSSSNLVKHKIPRESLLLAFDPCFTKKCSNTDSVNCSKETNMIIQPIPISDNTDSNDILVLINSCHSQVSTVSANEVHLKHLENISEHYTTESAVTYKMTYLNGTINPLEEENPTVKQQREIMGDYRKVISIQLDDLNRLEEERKTDKQHLASLRTAFSDINQKYECSKKIIDVYKSNEDTLRQNLLKSEQKCESLQAQAKAQIEKFNQDWDVYKAEVNKLNAVVKLLQIKISSLMDFLEQKNKDYTALISSLSDEVTTHRQ